MPPALPGRCRPVSPRWLPSRRRLPPSLSSGEAMAKSTAKLAKSKSRPGGLTLMIAIAFAALAALAALPLVFVLVPGMTPTLVTLFVDRQRSRYVGYAVGAMNFAGVLPFLLVLAKDRLSMPASAAACSDPFSGLGRACARAWCW